MDNKRAKLVAALLLASACTSGCGSPEIYTGERKSRERVVLPTPSVIAQPAVVVIGDLAVAIPLVGQARVAANVKRGQRIKAALSSEGFDAVTEFQESLASELKKVGAPDVSTLSVPRATPSEFVLWPDPEELPRGSGTDCFIDVHLVYGFFASVTGADYKPYMVANLTVLRGEDHASTYAEKFSYNFLGTGIEITPTTPLASWNNGAAVEADVRGARDAFRTAIGDLSKAISSDLQSKDHLGKC